MLFSMDGHDLQGCHIDRALIQLPIVSSEYLK